MERAQNFTRDCNTSRATDVLILLASDRGGRIRKKHEIHGLFLHLYNFGNLVLFRVHCYCDNSHNSHGLRWQERTEENSSAGLSGAPTDVSRRAGVGLAGQGGN